MWPAGILGGENGRKLSLKKRHSRRLNLGPQGLLLAQERPKVVQLAASWVRSCLMWRKQTRFYSTNLFLKKKPFTLNNFGKGAASKTNSGYFFKVVSVRFVFVWSIYSRSCKLIHVYCRSQTMHCITFTHNAPPILIAGLCNLTAFCSHLKV